MSATAASFFEAVSKLMPHYIEELTLGESAGLEDTSYEAITFLQQWKRLEPNAVERRDRRHNFFAGHEPEWGDIRAQLPARRDAQRSLINSLEHHIEPGAARIQLLVGDAFTGKSTLLLMAAQQLLEDGFAPFLFDSDVAPDIGAVRWWLQRHPKTVLLIDNAEDFARDIAALAKAVADDPLTLRVLAAERTHHVRHIESQLVSLPLAHTKVNTRLSRREVDSLISKLHDNRRLGSITTLNPEGQRKYFEDRGRELFSSMAELERGRGFVARISDEYATLPNGDAKRLVQAVALTSKLSYGLPLKLVKAVCGIAPGDLGPTLDADVVADLLVIRKRAVHLRHRYFGSLIFDHCLLPEEKLAIATQIAEALSPHVSPSAIASSTVEYRIARSLMGNAFVMKLATPQDGLDFYAALEPAYDWNARFWEQRALAAADLGRYEEAFSWAKQGVGRRADSYTLNTVGVVLMRRALNEASSNFWPAESFETAERALAEARDLEGSQAEYPYEAFFNYVPRLLRKVSKRDRALNDQLRTTWLNWKLRVLALDPVTRERLTPTLDRADGEWTQAGMD